MRKSAGVVKLPHRLDECPMCGTHVVCGFCGNNCCNGSSGRQVNGADCDCEEAYAQQAKYFAGLARE